MITSCNFTAPNGEGSELGEYLINTYGPEAATKLWQKIHSEEMLEKYNWIANSKILTKSGELLPDVAEFLINALNTNEEVREAFLDKIVEVGNAGLTIPSVTTVSVELNSTDDADKILNGTQTQMLRFVPIPGIASPGDSATTYVDGMPMKVTYEGKRVAGSDDKVALGFSPNEDLQAQGGTYAKVDEWIKGGREQHIYLMEPVFKMLDLLSELGVETAEIPKDIDQGSLLRTLQDLLPEKLDKDGNPTGEFFNFEGLSDAVRFLHLHLNNKIKQTLSNHEMVTPSLLIDGLNDAKKNLSLRLKMYKAHQEGKTVKNFPDIAPEVVAMRIGNFETLLNSFNSVVPFALDYLQKSGVKVNPKLKAKIADKLAYREVVKSDNSLEEGKLVEDIEDIVGEDVGRGVVDWTESAINLNPMDTAGKNVKFLLTAVVDSEFGQQTPPPYKDLKLPAHYESAFKAAKGAGFTHLLLTAEEFNSLGLNESTPQVSVTIGGKTRVLSTTRTRAGRERTAAIEETDFSGKIPTPWIESRNLPYSPDLRAVYVETFKPHNRQLFPKEVEAYGISQAADANELFNQILREVQSAKTYTEEGVMNSLKNSRIPNVVKAAELIGKAPRSVINEFMVVAKKQYLEHLILLYATKRTNGSTTLFATPINANKNSEREALISTWRDNQKSSKLIKEVNGSLVIDQVVAKKIRSSILSIDSRLRNMVELDTKTKGEKRKIAPGDKANADKLAEDAKKVFTEFFNLLGVELPAATVEEMTGTRLLGGNDHNTRDNSLRYLSLEALFKVRLPLLVNALFDGDTDNSVPLKNNNPLYSERRIIGEIAKMVMPSLENPVFGSSHKTAEGKTAYAFTHHTYESRTFQELKRSGANRLVEKMRSSPFTKNSWLLDELVKGDAKLEYLDAMQNTRNSNATVRSDMSPREQLIAAITAFEANGATTGNFIEMTKSDKAMTPVIQNITKLTPVEAKRRFRETFQAEYKRIQLWQDKGDEVDNDQFQSGGDLFYFMPDFNHEILKELVDEGVVTDLEFAALWNADGTVNPNGDPKLHTSLVDKISNRMVLSETKKLVLKMNKLGIVGADEYLLSDNGFRKLIKGVYAYDKESGGYRDPSTNRPVPKLQVHNEAALSVARAYVTNGMLLNMSLAMTVSGDPAMFYKKPKGSSTARARVASTMTEYQKRLAKDIAPGSDPNWDEGKMEYKTITIYDTEIDTDIFGAIDSAADAQELTTVREHLYVMYSMGKIPSKSYAEMIAIIDEGLKTSDKYYEFTDPTHLAVVMQAMKPVYVNRRFDDNGLMFIDYVKSSSFPLLPQLTIGRDLDALRVRMEGKSGGEDYIARAHFASAKKAGRPAKPAILFNPDGTMDLDALNNPRVLDSAVQTLNRDGFRIQQEVPYEAEKAKIHVVTQMDKLFVEGIEHIDKFTVGDRVMTGKELRAAKEQNRTDTFQSAYEKFVKSVGGVKEDGSLVDTKLFYDKLVEEAIARDYPKTDVDALKQRIKSNNELRIPLWFNGSIGKLEPMILSLITKIVINKIPGKSYIQASSLGMKSNITLGKEDPRSGIVLTGSANYDPNKGLQFMRNEDGKVIAAQVMIPFQFFDSEGNAVDIKNFLVPGTNTLDTEKMSPALLNLIGARIPNQGFSSMIPLEVVGFLPSTMGDLVMVPPEITAQMGADFDVDKLYTYKRNYTYADGVLSAESAESGDKALQEEYFNMHWGVLTHPEMFDRITSPLDKQDLVEEMRIAKEIIGEEEASYFFSPIRQLDDYSAQKDAKTLVAVSSLWSTFGADVQSHNIKLVRTVFTEAGIKKIPYYVNMKSDDGRVIRLHHISEEGVSSYNGDPRSKIINNTIQQNEFLDYSKNRTIDFFNLNRITYPASAVLSLLSDSDGNGVDLRYNTRLLQQEIIKEFVSLMDGNDSLSTEYTPDLRDSVTNALLVKYAKLAGLENAKNVNDHFNPEELLNMLKPETERNKQYYYNQIAILKTFSTLLDIADTLSSAMSTYNTDSKGPGASMLKVMERTSKHVNEPMSLEGIGEFVRNSQKGKAFEFTVNTANDMLSSMFPYEKIGNDLNRIAQLMGKAAATDLREAQLQEITNHIKAYMLSLPVAGITADSSKTIARLLYDSPAGDSLAKRVQAAKTSWGSSNYFLKRLHIDISTTNINPSTVNYNGMKATNNDVEENFKGFLELLMGNEEQKALGHDLAAYALLTDGSGGSSSFIRYIPTVYYTGTGLDKHLRDFMQTDSWSGYLKNFKRQYIQHNPTKSVRYGDAQLVYAIGYTKGSVNEFISIAENDKFPAEKNFHVTQKNVTILYEHVAHSAGVNTYQRIDILGNGRIKEYDPTEKNKRSVILKNRSLFAPVKKEAENHFGDAIEELPQPAPSSVIIGDESSFLSRNFLDGSKTEELAYVIEGIQYIGDFPLLTHLQNVAIKAGLHFQVSDSISDPDIAGSYKLGTKEIKLNGQILKSEEQVARILTHELAHGLTAQITKDIRTLGPEKAAERYGKEAVAAYNRLDALRLQIIEQLPNTPVNVEATSSVDEFISYSLTDKRFQEVLNGVRTSPQQSMFEAFVKAISDLISAVAEQFGIVVEGGSALEESILNIEKMLSVSPRLDLKNYAKDVGIELLARSDDHFGWGNADDSPFKLPPEMEQAISDLQALKSKLMNMQVIASTDSEQAKAAYQNRQAEINTIDAEIDQITKAGDFAMLLTIGGRQLSWAQSIYNKKNLSYNEYLSALRVANTWTNLIDKIYQTNGELPRPKEFDTIYGKAAQIASGIEKKFKATAVLEDGKIITSIEDFNPENLKVGLGVGYTLDLGQGKSNVAQALYDVVAGVNRVKGQEVTKLRASIVYFQGKVNQYIEKQKTKGVVLKHQDVMDMMIQDGKGWGMVDRFTPAFHHFQNNLRADLEKSVEGANKVVNTVQRQKLLQKIKGDLRNKLNNNMHHVDFGVMFDENTGDRVTTAASVKAYNALVDEVGKDVADIMISQARQMYEEFLEDKNSLETELGTVLESNISALPSLFAEHLKNLSKPDKKEFLAQKQVDMQKDSNSRMSTWVNENSPAKFYKWLNGDGLYSKFRAYNKLVMAPKTDAPDGKFFDENYTKITQDADLYEIYNFLRGQFDKHIKFLPTTVRSELNNNFIPHIQRGSFVNGLNGASEYVARSVMEGISTESGYLDSLGNGRSNIPIRYLRTNELEETDRERDLMVLLEKFGKMSLHFKHMSKVQSYAELMQQVVRSSVLDMGSGHFGKMRDGTNLLANQIDHFLSTIMYEKTKDKEGKMGKVYTDNPLKIFKAKAELEQLLDEEKKATQDVLKSKGEEGAITQKEFAEIMKRVRARKTEILDKERVVMASDLGDVAIKITQLKALAYNPISALANLGFGIVSTYIHAAGGIDFTTKEVNSAVATMVHATKKSLSYGRSDSPTAKKILALVERLDIMGDLIDADIAGGSRVKAKREGWRKNLSAFQMMRQSDYFAKGLIAVAMAKGQKVTIDGVEMSLWDAMDEASSVASDTWSNEDPTLATDFIKFQNRAIGVTKIIMGNQDSSSPILIKKKVLGRAISQFRTSWMAEGANNRFQNEKMNHQLGRVVKGRYISYHELGFGHSALMFLKQGLSILTKTDAYKDSKGNPLSPVDLENMKRNFAEVKWFLASTILVLMFVGMQDDDEDKERTLKLTINILLRLQDDISFYANSASATEISGSAIPATRVVTDFTKAVGGAYKLITKDEDSSFTGEDAFNRWMKVFPYTSLYPKFNYMTDRILD